MFCMTFGASWNAQLDIPVTDADVEATLDRARRDDFLKAMQRDSSVADKVIADAAAQAEGGLITEMPTGISIAPEVETLTVKVEREAVRRMAEARAAADVAPGTRAPGIGEITEGLVFEVDSAGRKVPTFVSVLMARGLTHRVIRKRGKYLVQTLAGRTVASEDTLALALLLFALLEKKRRDAEREEDGDNNESPGNGLR